MRQNRYVQKAIILTVTGLVLRAAGMFLRAYIAKSIGTEGMGVYQLLQTAYMMFVTVCTAGLNITATRLTADALALHNAQAKSKVLRKLLLLAGVSGFTCMATLLCGAPLVAHFVLHEPRIVVALRVLAAGLPFMALSAVLRGYFMAHQNIRPNTLSQLLEQAVRITIILWLLTRVQAQTINTVCTFVAIGTAASEMISWMLMLAFFMAERTPKESNAQQAAPKIFGVLGPVAGSQILSGTLRTVENVLVPAKLTLFTQNRETALSQFGILKGMALPILFFPFSFLSPLTTLLMPQIAVAYVQKNKEQLQMLIYKMFVFTGVFACMVGGMFFVFARPISLLLYANEESSRYLCAIAPLMPCMYLESIADGILKGVDEQKACFRFRTIDALLRIGTILCLVPYFGMRGFLVMMYMSNLFTFIIHMRCLLKKVQMRFPLKSSLLLPLFAVVAAGSSVLLLYQKIINTEVVQLPQTILGGIVYLTVFCIFLFLVRHDVTTGWVNGVLHDQKEK